MLNLNLGSRMRWARSLARDARVGLRVSPNNPIPCTDGHTIFMPALSNEWKDGDMDLAVWDGVLWHEICHIRHRADFELLERLQLDRRDPRSMLLNIVVDHNIELAEYGQLSGRDNLIDTATRWACKRFQAAPDGSNPTTHKILAAQAFSLQARLRWTHNLDEKDVAVPLSGDSQRWLDRLLNELGLLAELATIREDGEPNWEMTQKISRLLHLDPDQLPEPETESGKGGPSKSNKPCNGKPSNQGEPGEGAEPGGSGMPTENGPGKGETQEDENPAENDPEGPEEDQPSQGTTQDESDDYDSPAPSEKPRPGEQESEDGEEEPGKQTNQPREPQEIDYREIQEATGQLTPVHLDQMDAAKSVKTTGYFPRSSGSEHYIPMDPEIDKISATEEAHQDPRAIAHVLGLVNSATLQKTIRRELQAMSQAAWEGNKTRGRINRRAIGGIACNLVGRPFQQKRPRRLLNTAISLLVDTSGSMDGAPYYHAAAAAILMSDCFSSLGMATEIIGFSGHNQRPTFTLHKEFAEHRPTIERLAASFVWAARKMGNTPDGESTVFALARLAKRKEKRKMIFTLTDGSPGFPENRTGDVYHFTQRVIKAIEADSRYEIYGIGLMDDNVTRLYKEHLVIRSVQDLERDLLMLIRNKILKNT